MKQSGIIDSQARVYREQFAKHPDSPLGLFWIDRETQGLRFERLVQPFLGVLHPGVSLHDLGCGAGDLHQYLLSRKVGHEYSGTEIVPEMVEHVRARFPGVKVYRRDVLRSRWRRRYDIVVMSGVVNLLAGAPRAQWKRFVYRLIDRMFDICRIGIAFNFLTTYGTFQDKGLSYLDPKEVFDHCCRRLSRFVLLDHGYPLYEGTMAVFREEHVAKSYRRPEFRKYFKQ